MPYYFCWGETFLAIYPEFWPWQIAEIRLHVEDLFKRRPRDDDLECAAQIRASIIPFEMYGYGLVLVLRKDVWSLEVAKFPPHARPGEGVPKARRLRERKERKEARTQERLLGKATQQAVAPVGRRNSVKARSAKKARTRKGAKKQQGEGDAKRVIIIDRALFRAAFSMLYNIVAVPYENLKQFGQKIASLLHDTNEAVSLPSIDREQLLDLVAPSQEQFRQGNIAAWTRDRLPPGYQRERRLFLAEVLPIWIDTIGPKNIFVCCGRSIFGERFLESECVS